MKVIQATFPQIGVLFYDGIVKIRTKKKLLSYEEHIYNVTDIKSVQIIARDTTPSAVGKLSAIKWGRALGGKDGATVGAILGGHKNDVTLHFIFKDGHELIGICDNKQYQEYLTSRVKAEMELRDRQRAMKDPQYLARKIYANIQERKAQQRLNKILWWIAAILGIPTFLFIASAIICTKFFA